MIKILKKLYTKLCLSFVFSRYVNEKKERLCYLNLYTIISMNKCIFCITCTQHKIFFYQTSRIFLANKATINLKSIIFIINFIFKQYKFTVQSFQKFVENIFCTNNSNLVITVNGVCSHLINLKIHETILNLSLFQTVICFLVSKQFF